MPDAIKNLNEQFKGKVVPFCKEHDVALLATTPGMISVVGTQADLAGLLGPMFEALLEQKVFTVQQILSILAIAQTTVEKEKKEED